VLSWETICEGGEKTGGVGGSGLFTSEFWRLIVGGEGVGSMGLKSSKDTVCGVLEETSFPCRCLGAGGGFFFSFLVSPIRLVLSSSDAIISSDVRGVSECGSCTGSNIDCCETEEVSVPLLLSRVGGFGRAGEGAACGTGAGPELRGLVIPVMSMFLKPSTSNDGFVVPSSRRSAADRSGPQCQQMFERTRPSRIFSLHLLRFPFMRIRSTQTNSPLLLPANSPLSRSCGSMVASVFANGFAGAPLGDCRTVDTSRLPVKLSIVPCTSVSRLLPYATPSVCSKLLAKPSEDTGGGGLVCCA
jgi:hypothetical protein